MPNNKSDKQIRKYLSFDGREATSNVTNINQGYNNTLYLADGTIVTFGWVMKIVQTMQLNAVIYL